MGTTKIQETSQEADFEYFDQPRRNMKKMVREILLSKLIKIDN